MQSGWPSQAQPRATSSQGDLGAGSHPSRPPSQGCNGVGSPRTRKRTMVGSATRGLAGQDLRTPISFLDWCAQPHGVTRAGISLKGAGSELFSIATDPLREERPPSAWFCQPDPGGHATGTEFWAILRMKQMGWNQPLVSPENILHGYIWFLIIL